MQRWDRPASRHHIQAHDPWKQTSRTSVVENDAFMNATLGTPLVMTEPSPGAASSYSLQPSIGESSTSGSDDGPHPDRMSLRVGDFVEQVFIPKYVLAKRTAGRAHFQAILKHILSPERTTRAFRAGVSSKSRLSAVPGWPYLDDLSMSEVTQEDVEHLIRTCLDRGYSSQMATHVRNVIRNIFSCAVTYGYYSGVNPTAFVSTPVVAHKPVPVLSLSQLRQIFNLMRYPEQYIALFALMTDMNVAEICGLKWKYINLSTDRRYLAAEYIPERTIAVKMQSYRGEYRDVIGKRNRMIPIPELLYSSLQELRHSVRYNANDHFVLSSRRGTPVNPDNIATRRLKWIAKSLEMPWLSWKVFHRTGISLQRELGRYFNKEMEKTLSFPQ
jgi:integrase